MTDMDWAEEFANNMAIISRQRGNSEVGGSEIAAALRAAETRGIAKGLREAAQIADGAKMDIGRYQTMQPMSVAAIGIRDECLRRANNLEHPNTEGKG